MTRTQAPSVNSNDDGAFRLPSIVLPKGGGAIRGMGEKFAATPVSGTGSMSIPIAVPTGRAGFAPSLALRYDSASGNGPFGFGWSLGLPSISRRTDKGLPRYDDTAHTDVFVFAGADDLVPVSAADGTRHEDRVTFPGFTVYRYRPRIEGVFARIERWVATANGETHWRSISRDNVTTLYGNSAASRVADPSDTARVLTWLVCESYDDRGNAMRYEYAAEDNAGVDPARANERNRDRRANRYLKRIWFGNRTSRLVNANLAQTDWLFEVVFDYDEAHIESVPLDAQQPVDAQHRFVLASEKAGTPWTHRADAFSAYRGGFEVRTTRRCRRVLSFHRIPELAATPYLVRATEFDYDDFDYSKPHTVASELAHHGSTRVASFIARATQYSFERDESQPPVQRNGVTYHRYLAATHPSVEFEYSQAVIDDTIRTLDADSGANLPIGVDGSAYRWVDLHGEGAAGVLTEHADAWYYKPNLGDGQLGAQTVVAAKPSIFSLRDGAQLLDLAGDGRLDLARFSGATPGFHERADDGTWSSFTPFRSLPRTAWSDPNLRFVDLTGDGRADVLITEATHLSWMPSLGEDGFGAAVRAVAPLDEERGAQLVFADGTQSIYLADMCGDGLAALVRIRNGEVAYWPNLGYGRFGAKVTMDAAPWFDREEQFEQARIRLADIDGSGTNDIIYLGRDGAQVWFNQSGNRWSAPRALTSFPQLDALSTVATADLLGNGTACLVWSSGAPSAGRETVRYLDLMGGNKPHLMIGTRNGLGSETRIAYASSSRFLLADKAAQRPWRYPLASPVHVVERVEVFDRISRNRMVTRYAYHDGHYDGTEREFRGFGMVEQWDTESFALLAADGMLPPASNIDSASHVPPVLTKTWFHTGDESDTESALPAGLSLDERREALRALKGSVLRQEVFALDGSPREASPYTVALNRYAIRLLQARGRNAHAVVLAHQRDVLSYTYERDLADPRILHAITLEVDDVGIVRRTASIGYPRQLVAATLSPVDQAEQARTRVTYTTTRTTNGIDDANDYRTPVVWDTATYEVTGIAARGTQLLAFAEVDTATATAADIAYEVVPPAGVLRRRCIERTCILFRRNDLSVALAPGRLESLALRFERYRLALTAGLVSQVYGNRVSSATLSADGGYVHFDGDSDWWIPSGQTFYSPRSADLPAAESAYARGHFFLALRQRDPFHSAAASTESAVVYDAHDLLVVESVDALGNRTTVGERAVDPALPRLSNGYDYRSMQPLVTMDPNRNRTAIAVDALGHIVATAVMGKPEDALPLGDRLTGVERNLTAATIASFFANPLATAPALLGRASTRLVYDIYAYHRTMSLAQPLPVVVATIKRETHDAELAPGASSKLQCALEYSDGFGRVVQQKAQAAGRTAATRWTGSGWKVFNNKGAPVRAFEPFFSSTHAFEMGARIGVSSWMLYDPLGRVVATLHPDHSWEKRVFGPWREATWDAGDTVLITNPAQDVDVGDAFARLPATEYLPTWHEARAGGALGAEAMASARKAERYAATPTITHTDSLGRAMLTVLHNRFVAPNAAQNTPPVESFPITRVVLDIEGQHRAVVDARGITMARFDVDIVGRRLASHSSDAASQWTVFDVKGTPIHAFDSRGHQTSTRYDTLRRPLETIVRDGNGARTVGRLEYGEAVVNAESRNLRGRAVRQFDQAGVMTTDLYDFKGNALRNERRLAMEYRAMLDWSAAPPLEATSYVTSSRYDALNRPFAQTSPDGSVMLPTYDAAGTLTRIDARLRGAGVTTPIITLIEYNARGQRTRIDHATRDGTGITTRHEYDPERFRLLRTSTLRNGRAPNPANGAGDVQELNYSYDPVGNVSRVRDDAQQTLYFRNRRVEPSCDYVYDAIGRLIEASGREHLGLNAGPAAAGPFSLAAALAHPGDADALGTYVERFAYDDVGNLLSMRHRGSNPAAPGWSRCYQYALDSNRLISTGSPSDPNNPDSVCAASYAALPTHADRYAYDAHGNMTAMPHLALMQWDYRDALQATAAQVVNGGATPETTWYQYGITGDRVRKVTDDQALAGQTPVRKSERIYLQGFEIYREYAADGVTPVLVRDSLHVMVDTQRIALVETRADIANAPSLMRYQFGTLVGSASLELDDDAGIISYEEYFPYGATSYRAARSATEAAKRYRFTARERDEETGLSYHGARYYASWLGRWTAADPIGINDGVNVYQYVAGNPIRLHDPTGTDGKAPEYADNLNDQGKPLYTSHGDQLVKDSKAVGKKVGEEAIKSDELKDLKKLVLDPQLSRLTGGLEKEWNERKGTLILGGIVIAVPVAATLTYFMINDKKLDLPVVGEQHTRELGWLVTSKLVDLGSGKLLGDKGKIGVSYEEKNGKDRYGYQQEMPFGTDKLKFSFDSRFGADYSKLELGLTYKPDSQRSFGLSGSGEGDAGKTNLGAKLDLKFPVAGAPFTLGATAGYASKPDAGASNFTGRLEALYAPKIGGNTVNFGFQGFVNAPVPKDSPFMPKSEFNKIPQGPVSMFTPAGNGGFLSITIFSGTGVGLF